MTQYLLDTNHATRLLAGEQTIVEKVRGLEGAGHTFGVSMTVLGELYFAVEASARREKNLVSLHDFMRSAVLWDFDQVAAHEFGRVQAEQKRKGRPIPATDAQIAAVARIHGLTVLTADAHFLLVDKLTVENWLEVR